MATIKQHIPTSFSGIESKEKAFDSLAELLNIDWVSNFSNQPDFCKFSLKGNSLMAEYKNGKSWFVVGFIDGAVEGLPIFNQKTFS